MFKLHKIFILSLFIALFSCAKDNDFEQPPTARTVLVYMAADNNLYQNAIKDIEEMEKAILPANVHLLIYLDAANENFPQIFEIKNGSRVSVKQYEPQNSVSGKVLQQIITDVVSAFPAQSYGLVLWSHGTGWLPAGWYEDITQQEIQRSFGKEKTYEMEIAELANSLPLKFDFILFDACLMSNIETLYQLRKKADIIIASPTEILVAGFPYTEVAPLLFSENYAQIAQAYMNYYKSQTGILQSASIAIINTQELENLSAILKNSNVTFPTDKSTIQKYDTRANTVYYDLQDYLEHSANDNIAAIKQQIARTIIYRDYTPYFLNDLPLEKSCGISIFVFPYENDFLENQYKMLDWYRDTELLCR